MKTNFAGSKRHCGLALLCLCLCALLNSLRADPLDQWTLRNPLPTDEDLVGIAYGNSQFVAVGGLGGIVTSSDGINWVNRQSGATNRHFFAGITYGNNQFVAVGDAGPGPGIIVTSPDGINWTDRSSGTDYRLLAVAYGNNQFVALAPGPLNHQTVTSPDGVTWTPHTTDYAFTRIAYGNTQFVAVGGGQIASSSDGVTWTLRYDAGSGSLTGFAGIAYGNNQFVAVGTGNYNGTNQYGAIMTSPDGVTWTERGSGTTSQLNGVCYGNNQFVAVGTGYFPGGGGDSTTIVTSPDGITWNRRPSETTSGPLLAIVYGGSQFVAVGFPGSVVTSSDGLTWTSRGSGAIGLTGHTLSGIAFANNQFIAPGPNWPPQSRSTFIMSSDGLTWTNHPSGLTNALSAIAYGNNLYVAVGGGWDPTTGAEYGAILTSPDGLVWTARPSGTTNFLSAIAFGNNQFVAVGGGNGLSDSTGNAVVTSSDGVTWTRRTSGISVPLNGIAYGQNQFVAVGGGYPGTILTSPDGANWTIRDTGATNVNFFTDSAYGNNLFVAVAGVDILASPDGVSWIRQTLPRGTVSAIAYGNNQFVAVAGGCMLGYCFQTILSSPDGVTWTERMSGPGIPLYGIAFGKDTFVAVGGNGTILQSGVLTPPVITAPPDSLAVFLGSNATFRVSATGAPPLAYQWRSETGDIAGATNASLVISNVSLTDLGSYTVTVRNAYGEIISKPSWLKLARWTEMVVFGDSYSLAQFSNGKAWVDWLAQFVCLSAPAQMKNYAVGGAGTLAVRSQINQYLSANRPGTNTLLATTWAGVSQDLLNHLLVSQVVSNYATNLALLAQAGGRTFILPTIPPLYLVPAVSSDTYLRSIDYPDLNARMDQEIEKLKTNFTGLTVFRPDWSNTVVRVVANPLAYGFTNVAGAANACTQCDPNLYVFWDGLHPTTAGHRWLAGEAYRQLTPPLVMALPAAVPADGSLELQWQGGSPPFRVQHSDDLASGIWQSEALTFGTNAVLVPSAPGEFFRMFYLGQ